MSGGQGGRPWQTGQRSEDAACCRRAGTACRPRRLGVAVTALLMMPVISGGCGLRSTSPTVPVAGVVTHAGRPVPDITVTFTPQSGRSATGQTDATGRFTLATFTAGDGAVPGTHRVTFALAAADVPMPGTPEAASYKPPPLPFPKRYGSLDTTDLVVEISGSGNKSLELALDGD